MPYWQLLYHIVWATKNREPVLTPEIEQIINRIVRKKAISLGAVVFAMDGGLEHRHVISSCPPKISIAQYIGQLKGVSTAQFNQSGHPGAPIYWQDEYAVFSIDRRSLPKYIEYVERQKEHHSNDTTIPILELISGEGGQLIQESN